MRQIQLWSVDTFYSYADITTEVIQVMQIMHGIDKCNLIVNEIV